MNGHTTQQPYDEWTRRLAGRVAEVLQQVARLREEREAQTPTATARFAEYTRSAPLLTLGSGQGALVSLTYCPVNSGLDPTDSPRTQP